MIGGDTTRLSAIPMPDKYGWSAFAAGSNAIAFTASRSRTAMIEAALIARMLAVNP